MPIDYKSPPALERDSAHFKPAHAGGLPTQSKRRPATCASGKQKLEYAAKGF